MSSSNNPLRAVISQLLIYPVKSCAPVALKQALLTDQGLDLDRAWMVVDDKGQCLSQREYPRLALVEPQLRLSDLILRAPGMLALHLALYEVQEAVQVNVWGQTISAFDMGNVAAQWFSDFLGQTPQGKAIGPLRLVRFDPDHVRTSDSQWTAGVSAKNQFSDGFPYLVCSQSSLEGLNQRLAGQGHAAVDLRRFRPNIVLSGIPAHDEDHILSLSWPSEEGRVVLKPVKPCPRCPMPNVDPDTAAVNPLLGDVLQSYRQDPRLAGAVSFGMNAIATEGVGTDVEPLLRVGQVLDIQYRL